MKTTSLLIGLLLTAQLTFAQTTLEYSTHALSAGVDNPMTICEYMEPGVSGINQTWDFSELTKLKEFTGHINGFIGDDVFTNANTELEEFGTSFVFDITKTDIKQIGYKSKDAKTVIHYSEPFVKMKFPFAYDNNYVGTFGGTYTYNAKTIGEVAGTGTIEADAWGKLILPNSTIYENTLRVKTTKSYTITYESKASQDVEIITYRWYNDFHRYPLLVLTQYSTKSGTSTSVNYQAAYNNNAVSVSSVGNLILEEHMTYYPNPTKSELNLLLTAKKDGQAALTILDVTGKKVLMEVFEISIGTNDISLSELTNQLKSGSYMFVLDVDSQVVTREITITD